MTTQPLASITIEPIVSYPREAEPGKTYLMTVDLRFPTGKEEWPYNEEEYEIYCLLDSAPLFDNEEFGESVIVLHRFGGTYGPAMFLLTANPLEMSEPNGAITLTLANRQLMPLQVFKLDKIRVSANAVPSLETVPVIRQQVDSGTVNVDLNEKPGDPMIEPMEVDDLIVFNGIDATTGDYLIQPIKLSDVARIAIDSPQDKNLINAIINAKRQAEVKHL